MRIKHLDTRAALIKSGREAFLSLGFEKASLRDICANAHVTTGAFYSNFDKKEDLFHAVIKDELAGSDGSCDELANRLICKDLANGESVMVEFIAGHKDLFRLLFDCSKGTPYEGFKEKLLNKLEQTCQELLDSRAKTSVDPDIVHTITRMKFAQYCEVIYGDYDHAKVHYITNELGRFTMAGLDALLGMSA